MVIFSHSRPHLMVDRVRYCELFIGMLDLSKRFVCITATDFHLPCWTRWVSITEKSNTLNEVSYFDVHSLPIIEVFQAITPWKCRTCVLGYLWDAAPHSSRPRADHCPKRMAALSAREVHGNTYDLTYDICWSRRFKCCTGLWRWASKDNNVESSLLAQKWPTWQLQVAKFNPFHNGTSTCWNSRQKTKLVPCHRILTNVKLPIWQMDSYRWLLKWSRPVGRNPLSLVFVGESFAKEQ